jgi:hypothetical protein
MSCAGPLEPSQHVAKESLFPRGECIPDVVGGCVIEVQRLQPSFIGKIARRPRYLSVQSALKTGLFPFDPGLKFISFTTSHFEIKHQVLHIQTQLR